MIPKKCNDLVDIENARCLVIGADSLGSMVLIYLAKAGVKAIGICDQESEMGSNKAEAAAKNLQKINSNLKVISYPFRLQAENALPLIFKYDLILDCTHAKRSKLLINDAAFFAKKPLIRPSLHPNKEQLQFLCPERDDGCLRCLDQESYFEETSSEKKSQILSRDFGISRAREALKVFIQEPSPGSHRIPLTALMGYAQDSFSFDRKKNCPLCSENPTIFRLREL